MVAVIASSETRAEVVSTCVTINGRCASQVSVKCPLKPTQVVLRFAARMSVFVIRRADVERGWGNILRSTPLNHLFDALIILDPDPTQNISCWDLTEPLRSR